MGNWESRFLNKSAFPIPHLCFRNFGFLFPKVSETQMGNWESRFLNKSHSANVCRKNKYPQLNTFEMSEDQKKALEQQLWNIANTLRGKMNADEFRDYILGFIFYKYLSEKMNPKI